MIALRRAVLRAPQPRTAEIVCVGSELLSGDTVDTNSGFIGKRLPRYGIRLRHVHAVADDREYVSRVVREAIERADTVFVVGGLGPTMDDITRESVADALGEELIFDPALEPPLRAYFERRGAHMPDINMRQTQRIPSAQTVVNERGTAPGWLVEKPPHLFVTLLPGPPSEMMPMFSRQIEPRLAMRKYPPPYDAPLTILSRVIKVAGLGESTVQERLGDLVFSTQPEVGIYHKFGTVELKLTSSAPSLDECKRINVEVERQMVALLGDAVYGFDDDSLASSVATLLARRGATVAVHEVGSEGQLAAALARARPAGASAKSVLAAGTVAADPEGARLDPAAVAAAARAAQQRAKAHYGVAVSGVSQDGTTLVAVADAAVPGAPRVFRYVYQHGSSANAKRATNVALSALRCQLLPGAPLALAREITPAP